MSKPKAVLKGYLERIFQDINRRLDHITDRIDLLQDQVATINSQQNQITKLYNRFNNSGYIQLSENEVLTKIFTGAKMYLDPRDIGLVPHLILDGDWERNITEAWLKIVKKGDVVIDIGANFGYYSILAAQQTNRVCELYLFEANPNIIPYLNKSISVNSFEECSTIENIAISDKDSSVRLNILKDYIASSSLQTVKELNKYAQGDLKYELEESVEVAATTLDNYCKQKGIISVDLIKMDIEGHEEKAYKGMRNTIKSSPNITMFIEFTKEGYKSPKVFYEKLLKDFTNVYVIDLNGKLIKPTDIGYDALVANSDGWVMLVFSKKSNLANE